MINYTNHYQRKVRIVKYVYKVFEFFLENDRARNAFFWACWVGLLACAWSLPLWLYSGVVLFGALLCLHGLIDGYAESEKVRK